MRKIKFRGKPVDKSYYGEWIYGYYKKDLSNGEVRDFIVDCDAGCEVAPETIGQFTGLLDKDGKEIYEGDIVEFNRMRSFGFSCAGGSYGNDNIERFTGRIEFDDCFKIRTSAYPFKSALSAWSKKYEDNGQGRLDMLFINQSKIGGNDCAEYGALKVIGNIYDNPQLLNN